MKIFLDTANRDSINTWFSSGLIDGVTTNPTHLSKEKGLPVDVLHDICDLVAPCPVSIEVTETTPKAVYEQAKALAKLRKNVVVKIPCCKEYVSVIRALVQEDVALNITLVFSVVQALMMAKLGVAYVSPFIGRLEDIDSDGLELIRELRLIFDCYDYATRIIAASIRSARHVNDVALYGSDVATVKPELVEKMLDHPLTAAGMKIFAKDWKKIGIKQFP